ASWLRSGIRPSCSPSRYAVSVAAGLNRQVPPRLFAARGAATGDVMNVFRLVGLLALATLTACGESPAPPEESPDAAVSRPATASVAFPDTTSDAGPPRVEVVPVAQTAIASHEANAVAILVNDNDPAAARVLGSAGFGGIEAYDLAGQRLRQIAASGELK